jgi:large subunit ribosomal protein L32
MYLVFDFSCRESRSYCSYLNRRKAAGLWGGLGGALSDLLEQSMLPVKKMSKTRTRSRRAHHALRAVNYSYCIKCDSPKLPHAACDNCGYVNPKTTLKLAEEAAD